MQSVKPKYSITFVTIRLIERINRWIGILEGQNAEQPQVSLRKKNLIRTVHSTAAIEGNPLTIQEATRMIESPRSKVQNKESLEIHNAVECYQTIDRFSPDDEGHFLKAHALLMKGLIKDAGAYRSQSVGIQREKRLVHLAPAASEVPKSMNALFSWIKNDHEDSYLIRSAAAHYQIEFVHPFSDGNGRIGRFWQHLMLMHYHPVFEFIAIESIVKDWQEKYYLKLRQSDELQDCSTFVDFSLHTICEALREFAEEVAPARETPSSRLEKARKKFGKQFFNRKDYMKLFKTLSSATASRDLSFGVQTGQLERTGDKAVAKYRF